MKKIEYIVFHCSDSDFGNVEIIRRWHTDPKPQGRGWRDIGYNGVILNGKIKSRDVPDPNIIGKFEEGRGIDLDVYVDSNERGAHVLNYNSKSLGICLIGKDKFEIEQFETALYFAKLFLRINPHIKIMGHYEMPTARGKTCPNFDMSNFRNLVTKTDITRESIRDLLSESIK